MSLVREQSYFIGHVAELIKKAHELGFEVSGGELYRTPEQQALYLKNGRSKTMNSQHLKRLAIDLYFFQELGDGSLKLIDSVEQLKPLGDYWESLDSSNQWGGNWSSFKDTPHFERKERSAAAPFSTNRDSAASNNLQPSLGNLGKGLIIGPVGQKCSNNKDDVETVQRLLNESLAAGAISLENGPLKCDGIFGEKSLKAIESFKRSLLGEQTPVGSIEPTSEAFVKLCSFIPAKFTPEWFGLLFLKADESDIADFSKPITDGMAKWNINSPIRQAHFLAQIGHESGELRFREEIASGSAYEGRNDLGNTQPGDGIKYKGRGLIQLTGRANYAEYGRDIGREKELLESPDLVKSDLNLCVGVAGWYWSKRQINAAADQDDLIKVTKKVNGGLNGIDERRRLLGRAKSLLGV